MNPYTWLCPACGVPNIIERDRCDRVQDLAPRRATAAAATTRPGYQHNPPPGRRTSDNRTHRRGPRRAGPAL